MRHVGDRPEPADAGTRRRFRVLHAHVWHREWRIHQAHAQLEGQLVFGIGSEDGADCGCCAALQPGYGRSALIEPGLQPLDGDRVIVTVAQIILTVPCPPSQARRPWPPSAAS